MRLSDFLGVPFDEGMLDPYTDGSRKMTDGIHALSKMLGDVKFHQHRQVDAGAAESWRSDYPEDFLGAPTWELATELGYPRLGWSPIEPRRPGDPTDRLPLSFGQHRLWFLDQLEPGSPTYNMPGAFRLSGRLDPAALDASLAEICRRHEVLRTTFAVNGGQPLASIAVLGGSAPLVQILSLIHI